MRKIHILLPAFNEALALPILIEKIDVVFRGDRSRYSITICNDGSKDETGSVIESYQRDYPIEAIEHWINRGLGETVRDLFEHVAKKCDDDDIVVRFDCDDTHDPALIPQMVEKIDAGFDVVIASRFASGGGQKGVGLYRGFISSCANWIMKCIFPLKGVREYSCAYRAYRGALVKKAVSLFGNEFIQLKGLGFTASVEKLVKLKMLGARFAEVGFVLRYDRKQGESKMVTSVTTLGYFVLMVLYHWPWGGWRRSKRHAE